MLSRRELAVRAGALLAASACERAMPSATQAPATSERVPAGLRSAVPGALAVPPWVVTERGHARLRLTFQGDPLNFARVRLGDREAQVTRAEGGFGVDLDLSGLSGPQEIQLVETLGDGSDVVVSSARVTVSAPVYVVWTIDYEGYDEPDGFLANIAAVGDNGVPLTLLFNTRMLVPGTFDAGRREAILRWTRGRLDRGDELGLHLHMQFDLVRDAGVAPRRGPKWGSSTDGYDVPMTAYDEEEQRRIVRRALEHMARADLPRPASFRAGALFADARTFRVIAAEGFSADTSATEAGVFFNLRWPWTLPPGAQPYRPNRDDANRSEPPRLELLEVPNNAGNTFGIRDAGPLLQKQRAIWSGSATPAPRVLDYVSHPFSFEGRERAVVEVLFEPLLAARAERDAGPVRFVRLRDLVGLLG